MKMEKILETQKGKYTIKDGDISCPNGKVIKGADKYVEVSAAPRTIQKSIKDNKIDVVGMVWFSDHVVIREVADESVRQYRIVSEENDPENRIEGLRELRRLENEWERCRRNFNRMMSDEYNDGACPDKGRSATAIETDIASAEEKYPRAVAYLKAESFAFASNSSKSSAGERALEAILADEDYSAAVETMETEWSQAAEKAAWND
jgi:hypothetical protein